MHLTYFWCIDEVVKRYTFVTLGIANREEKFNHLILAVERNFIGGLFDKKGHLSGFNCEVLKVLVFSPYLNVRASCSDKDLNNMLFFHDAAEARTDFVRRASSLSDNRYHSNSFKSLGVMSLLTIGHVLCRVVKKVFGF